MPVERSAIADATGRLQRRQQVAQRRRLLRLGAVVVVVVALGAVIHLVAFSSVFAVRTLEVRGTSLVSAAQVEQTAQVPRGVPLVRLDISGVERRVLALPEIKAVKVTRSLPGKVVISVTERRAVYAMSSGSGYSLVDSEGVSFHEVADLTPGLLVANLTDPRDQRLRRDTATVVVVLPDAVRARAVLVSAATPDQIVIELSGGARLVWGSAEQSEQKAQVAAALLTQAGSVYDVSSPSHPAITL